MSADARTPEPSPQARAWAELIAAYRAAAEAADRFYELPGLDPDLFAAAECDQGDFKADLLAHYWIFENVLLPQVEDCAPPAVVAVAD